MVTSHLHRKLTTLCRSPFSVRFTFSELLSSEHEYVERLTSCVTQYMLPITNPNSSAPKTLRGVADQLFGNIEDILNYHQKWVLEQDARAVLLVAAHCLPTLLVHREMVPQLEKCQEDMAGIGGVFTLAAPSLKSLYVTYCRGKPRSDDIYQDHLDHMQVVATGEVCGRVSLS